MADKKISALTASTTPLAGTEVLPIVQSGATVKVSVANLTAGRAVSMSDATLTGVYDQSAYAPSGWIGNWNNTGASGHQMYFGYNNGTSNRIGLYIAGGPGVANQLDLTVANKFGVYGSSGVFIGTPGDPGANNISITGSTQTDGLVSHAGTGGAFNSNKFNFQWTGSPALWVDATLLGNINYTSDYRIKRNIASQTESGLAKVMQLRPVVYQLADYANLFKASDDIKEGFIAHEVQEVIPSGVEGAKDAEDQIQSLRLDAILSVAIKAIQEQQAQIEALKADVAALKGA
jgi:hypothetical protein